MNHYKKFCTKCLQSLVITYGCCADQYIARGQTPNYSGSEMVFTVTVVSQKNNFDFIPFYCDIMLFLFGFHLYFNLKIKIIWINLWKKIINQNEINNKLRLNLKILIFQMTVLSHHSAVLRSVPLQRSMTSMKSPARSNNIL